MQMKSIAGLVKEGYGKELNLNCAETILYTANEAYGLGIKDENLKVAAGFGGGMGVGGMCGALSAGVMVMSYVFIQKYAREEGSRIKKLTSEFIKKYEEQMEGISCAVLIPKYRTKERGCSDIIMAAAVLLDGIVSRELKITLIE